MSHLIQIVLGATAMEITPEPVATEVSELLPINAISGVYPVKYNLRPSPLSPEYDSWKYEYDSMTVIGIVMKDGREFKVELQNVTNQATWSTGLNSGLQAAVAAIKAWLP